MSNEPPGQLPTDEEVISALEKTGFLLEHRVAKYLRNHGFDTVEINSAYPDPDSGKSREIDVRAALSEEFRHEQLHAMVAVDLVIECKNTLNPFVVVGEQAEEPWPYLDMVSTFDPFKLQFYDESSNIAYNPVEMEGPFIMDADDFIGRQLLRMDRQHGKWQAGNKDVHDSILYPLAKATESILKEGTSLDNRDYWKGVSPVLSYLMPVIVTTGPVYTVDGSSDPPSVSRVKWTRLQRDFKTIEKSSSFASDLVSFEFLGEYVERRPAALAKQAKTLLIENSHLYDPEWLLNKYGQPRDEARFEKWLEYVRQRRSKNENGEQSDQ